MKQKNSNGSFGGTLFTLMLSTLFLSLIAVIVIETATGKADFSRLGTAELLQLLLNGVLVLGLGAALCLRWREKRIRDRELGVTPEQRKSRRRKLLASLIVFGIIVTGPFWIPIDFVANDLADWLLSFAVYLGLIMVFIMFPCYLIYSLGKALSEKEMEKEEMNEAKKY